MIEVAILDNTERLLQASPPVPLAALSPIAYQISGISFSLIYAAYVGASTIGQSLSNWSQFHKSCPSSDFSKIWTPAYAGQTPANKCILFDMSTETVGFDDTGNRGFIQIVTDNIGTVWAQSSVNFGLWKRTGAGTWTQMLTDSTVAAGAAGVRYRASDNTYWYQSSTANHYQLANGAATLQSAPTGTLVQVGTNGWNNLDAPYFHSVTWPNPAAFLNADGTTVSTNIPVVPHELQLVGGGSNATFSGQVHIDSTYSILWSNWSALLGTYPAYFMYVMNKVSGVIKFIGCVPAVTIKVGANAASAQDMTILAAKWSGTGLQVYFRGNVGSGATFGGIIRADIPYQPNF